MYNNVFNFMNKKELIYNISLVFVKKTLDTTSNNIDKITKILDSGDIVIEVIWILDRFAKKRLIL